jgi:hypothetical protein
MKRRYCNLDPNGTRHRALLVFSALSPCLRVSAVDSNAGKDAQ